MVLKDNELVAQAQEGDQRAIGELLDRYQQKAYGIAYNMCSGDSEEARDFTQEAFLRAIKNIKKFRKNSSFYTWFYRIVVNTCLDGIRRRRTRERVFSFWRWGARNDERPKSFLEEPPDTEETSNPMTILRGKQLTRDVKEALMSLPDKQRIVFQLKVLSEMSIREIAEVMGSAEGTVKSHLFRATHFMRKTLKQWTIP